jgi:hypothetical protein
VIVVSFANFNVGSLITSICFNGNETLAPFSLINHGVIKILTVFLILAQLGSVLSKINLHEYILLLRAGVSDIADTVVIVGPT